MLTKADQRVKFKKCFIFILIFMGHFCGLNCQTSQNINVLFVNEVGNDNAAKGVEVALNYIKKLGTLGLNVEVVSVEGNRTDNKGILEAVCSQYGEMLKNKKPPHVIFDTTKTGVSSETVKSISASLAIPTVSASYGQEGDLRQWRELSEEKKNFLLQVNPPADMIVEVVRSLVQKLDITNAAILYDESFVVDHKYKALLQNIPARHVITAIALDAKDRGDQIMKLRNLDINNYFILGTIDSIKKVLESAKKEYFERNFAWHAITQEKGELSAKIDNATIMFLKPIPDKLLMDQLRALQTTYNLKNEPEIEAAFYFDLALRTFLAVRDMIQKSNWPVLKFLTCDEYDGSNSPANVVNLQEAFTKVEQKPSYAPWKFGSAPFNGKSFMEFDVQISAVSILGGSSVSTKNVAKWRAGGELTDDGTEANIKNYSASTVYRVYTVVQPPFIIRDETAPKGYKGYCIDLINDIAGIVRFDYDIKEVEDGRFGEMNDNGDWNGVVRKLVDKQADIGLGSMSVMAERETVIDFTVPYYDLVGITILMQMPSQENSLFKFLTVLETNVWLCILAAYFFTSLLMWIFDRYSPYSYQNNRDKYKDDDEKREFTLKECLWFCMTSLTPQGGGEAPKNLSGRLVAATWWLFGFIIIASYTANLAAFLTVSRLDVQIESLDDLAKQYKILYAPLNGSSAMTYFQRMAAIEERFYNIWKDMSLNDSLSAVDRSKLAVWDYPVSDKYSKMWQAMQEAKMPNSLEDAVIRVRNSTSAAGFAFLGDATDIRYQVMINCDLKMVGEEFSRKPYAIAVQQGSPLKDQFNNAILQLLNKRQLEKFKERWWKKEEVSGKCEKPEDQSDGISIQNIGGVFIVIFVGIGMACITLLFEFWYYKFRKSPKSIIDPDGEFTANKFTKSEGLAKTSNNNSFGSEKGLIDTGSNANNALKSRHHQAANFRARF